MSAPPVERKLAAIFAADIAGYSRLMARDEPGTLARLKACRVITDGLIATHRGRIFNTAGDSVVADFASAVDAVACAVAVQEAIIAEDANGSADEPMRFRIGVHVGDVMVDGANLLGDGVNIAARLEALAEPGGICVSRVVRDQVRDKLDVTFEDLGEQQIKNIARPVRVYRIPLQAEAKAAIPVEVAKSALALPDNPSIAVLPFQNMSRDPEQEYFADGMVEEIITALSRIRWLFVIARNSSFTYKGQAVDVRQVGRELGVRYVLEGSVRKGGNRIRITAQLNEAETGAHLWADRFDGSLEDVFDLQDEIAIRVSGVIEPTLQSAEIRRSAARPTNDLSAYDLYLRAFEEARSWDRASTGRALNLLTQAIARDPHYGAALALAAHCHVMQYFGGASDSFEADRREGIDLAQRAIRAPGNDPSALGRAAYVLGNLGEDIRAAIGLVDHALEINPSYAGGWYYSGWIRLWAGQSNIAIDHFTRAARLSPYEMPSRVLIGIGISQFFGRGFAEARATLRRSLQEFPNWPPTYRFLAACCAHMGQLDEARQAIERLRAITSVIVASAAHWRDPEQRELYLSGLRLAAGETA